MVRLWVTALVVAGIFSPAFADSLQEPYDQNVLKIKNGYFWEYMKNSKAQTEFVRGFLEGYRSGVNTYYEEFLDLNSDKVNKVNKKIITKLTIPAEFTEGQFIQYIDEFYSDKRNRLLPVSMAFAYANQVLSGRAPEEISKWVEKHRQVLEKN